ncbi:hypothetical protein ONE63_002955 [Megalurothrips usitatus]|uniref:Cilia- and flagella-associated protein 43 n=1 Tax=Megalurothrips usitatus TaxID=439358 RepID=A0AAV7X5V4_9NEOP|nr:hypothetical protein ONE63_002955 [Megalurothrips usitatus]
MHPRKSLSYPQWVKLGKIDGFTFVGRDTVAVGCGCHIIFYAVDGTSENVYIANSKQRGDGVACLAGHRTAPLFAFAEKCLHPRILVFSYPAVEGPVSVLKGGTMGSYISMAFSEVEYLVTLSGVPQSSIMVWCWRTGVQLACTDTGIGSPFQKLSCSLSSPTIICHIVRGKSTLRLWEINVCAKLCCLTSQKVKLPEKTIPVDVCFTNDGALFFVDDRGDVYQASDQSKFNTKSSEHEIFSILNSNSLLG